VSAQPRAETLVVGAGIIGLACARALHDAGHHVAVLDSGPAGAGASTAAAGLLSPLFEAPSGPLADACFEARDLWQTWASELAEESGLDLGYDRTGALVPELEDNAAALAEWRSKAASRGEPVCELSRADLEALLPDLTSAATRGLLLPGEHRVDNVQTVLALLAALEQRGVSIASNQRVERVSTREGGVTVVGGGFRREAERLLLAAGAWSGTIDGLPIRGIKPVRGQMLRFEELPWGFSGSIRDGHLYAVRRGRSSLLVGATVEDVGFDRTTTEAGISALRSFAARLFPRLAAAPETSRWAGLRPGTLDDLPILGPLEDLPVVVATGHYRNGILLAPWTARVVDALFSGVIKPTDLRPFSPARFAVPSNLSTRIDSV
jgi:glycine oxidase